MRVQLIADSPCLRSPRLFGRWVSALGEAFVMLDFAHLSAHKTPPLYSLYDAGEVEYRNEGRESLVDVPVVLERGWGDCWHLACWRAAELRLQGDYATLRVHWAKRPRGGTKKRPRNYHVLVRHANGLLEDPSKRMGM